MISIVAEIFLNPTTRRASPYLGRLLPALVPWRGILLLFLLAAPTALAADRIHAQLVFADAPRLEGLLEASATQGGLDLAPDVARGLLPTISWRQMDGYALTRTFHRYGPWDTEVAQPDGPDNESIQGDAGRLEDLACAGRCTLFALSRGDAASLALRAQAADGFALQDVARVFTGAHRETEASVGRPDGFYHVVPAGALALGAGAALPLANATLQASGELDLALYNVSGVIVTAQGREPFVSGEEDHARPLVGGVGVETLHQVRVIVLRLHGASLASPPDSRSVLYADAASLRGSWTVRSASASGTLEVEGARRTLENESLVLRGAFDAQARGDPPGGFASRGPRLGMDVSGDAQEILVDGARVQSASLASPEAEVAGLALALLLLGALLRKAALWGFYSRIPDREVLAHPIRKRILQLARETPGLTIAQVGRLVGLSGTGARYHVRLLSQRGLLRLERSGRSVHVWAGAPSEERALARVLHGRKRLAIARVLLDASAPATQDEIAQATGYSQRLVAYHLAQLARGDVLARSAERPARYAISPGKKAPARALLERA